MNPRTLMASIILTALLTPAWGAGTATASAPSTQPATDPTAGYRLGPGSLAGVGFEPTTFYEKRQPVKTESSPIGSTS